MRLFSLLRFVKYNTGPKSVFYETQPPWLQKVPHIIKPKKQVTQSENQTIKGVNPTQL